jgi:hypothetical protein
VLAHRRRYGSGVTPTDLDRLAASAGPIAEPLLLAAVQAAVLRGSWEAAAWVLSRRRPQRWGAVPAALHVSWTSWTSCSHYCVAERRELAAERQRWRVVRVKTQDALAAGGRLEKSSADESSSGWRPLRLGNVTRMELAMRCLKSLQVVNQGHSRWSLVIRGTMRFRSIFFHVQ